MIPRNFSPEDLLRLRDMIQERLGQTVLDIHYKIRDEIRNYPALLTTTDVRSLSIFLLRCFRKVAVAGKVQLLFCGSWRSSVL